ncbi:hypothetical protein [Aeromonas hydrophila]|uniref:hypothetical protein n=1 Tax=Aeromonas hydrophila TaxID=644 RepID=UPI00114CDB76|nr:hypothetical protein [Aeromonas hydrophila]
MKRKISKWVVICSAIIGMYLAFAYSYICSGLTLTYNLSMSNMDAADFRDVYSIYEVQKIPFIAFNVFLVVLFLANRFLGSPTKGEGNKP